MKKILSLILVFIFIVALSACGKDEDTTVKDDTNKNTEQTESAEFKKPEEYATVLFVKINPEFNLYLDVEGNTVAVEPLNDDAKTIINDIDTTEKDYQKIISIIITSANKNGFLKTDSPISISVIENKSDKVNVDEILSKVNAAATQTITTLNIQVEIETANAIQTVEDETQTSDASDTQQTTTSDKKDKPVETSKPTEQNKQTETNKTTHKHEYSQATCTKPQTCSCGATKGSALGHTYNDDGICTRCKAKDPNFKYPALKTMNGGWILMHEEGDELFEWSFEFFEETVIDGEKYSYYCGERCYVSEDSLEEDERVGDTVVWNNKRYYVRGQGLVMEGTFYEEGTKIVLTDYYSNNKKVTLQRTSANMMKVISVDSGIEHANIPINTILTFDKKEVK